MPTATILVVEDEVSIQNVIRTYLESENFQVTCVADGLEALASAEAIRPDLIILDLMLPDMDGMEVAARLREAEGSTRAGLLPPGCGKNPTFIF